MFGNIGKQGVGVNISNADTLGVKDFANALATFIQDCETPMTIGIQGDWGLGKTSLMNMIDAYLKGTYYKSFGILWFNTWHYSMFHEDEYLSVAVISSLLDSMQRNFNIKKESSIFKDITAMAVKTLKSCRITKVGFPFGNVAIGKKTEEEETHHENIAAIMLDFKEKFKELVAQVIKENNYTKLVFFIDDIDRVRPIKALELLEAIKNFLDVENCVFLLAVDYEVVQMGMADKFGRDLQKTSGKSFFDKIIQLPFTMPSTSYELMRYINRLLRGTNLFILKDNDSFYEEITICTVGRNPRSIKRVINYAQLIMLIRNMNKSKADHLTEKRGQLLYALLCMQVAWPEIFAHFIRNPAPDTIKNLQDWDYIDHIPFINKVYDRSPDREQLKNNITTYFDSLFSIVDTNCSGEIDENELKEVWKILSIAKLTNVKDFSQPTDIFFDNVKKNGKGKYDGFIEHIFKRSKWASSGKLDYRISGIRYMTIIKRHKQIGSFVTLITRPFVFRLDFDEGLIQKNLGEKIKSQLNFEDFVHSNDNPSLTGFGNTIIDVDKLMTLDDTTSIKILNAIFEMVIEASNKKN
jgi:hypothetical protein